MSDAPHCTRAAGTALLLVAGAVGVAMAEDAWNPFKEKDLSARERRQVVRPKPERVPALPPMGGVGSAPWRLPAEPSRATVPAEPGAAAEPASGPSGPAGANEREALPPLGEKASAVERGELAPVMTADGSGLPAELWQGVDPRAIEDVLARLELPPRSRAMHGLWRRLWTSSAEVPAGSAGAEHFAALRLEALFRTGFLREAEAMEVDLEKAPLAAAVKARIDVATGARDKGCATARRLARGGAGIAPGLKSEMLMVAGYCAAAEGNRDAAALALEVARGEGASASFASAALDAFASGQPFKPAAPKRLGLIDYRFLELTKAAATPELLAVAEPALLVALAQQASGDALMRIQAGEAAARINALDAEGLGEVYRGAANLRGEAGDPLAIKADAAMRRAQLFRAVEVERTPMRKARLMRALLDDARRARLAPPIAAALARAVESLVPAQEIGWIAETAIEINLAAGRPAEARKWLDFALRDRGDRLQHWALLIDIADSNLQGRRGEGFAAVEQMALKGRLAGDLLHRLAIVLDALDYQIPIPLWEAASRTPQPTGGPLPETGVLTQLQEAAKRREFARTVLVGMRAIGPVAADGANLIALGDTVRALKRGGLEADARALALEALMAGWPRTAAD